MARSTHHIIPEGESFCIWMDAGVVSYKLCTSHFSCEDCMFDAKVRMRHTAFGAGETCSMLVPRGDVHDSAAGSPTVPDMTCASTLQRFLEVLDAQPLPDDRLYSQNHTWAKADGDGSYVLGIDHFVGAMLGAGHSVAFSVPPSHIKAADPYAWIVANGETLAVCSPLSGTIVENNTALANRSSAIHADPYERGWIARLLPDEHTSAATLSSGEAMADVMSHDRKLYERSIQWELQRLQTQLAGTMYDGGTMLENFEDILGTKKYYGILERFLRPRS